MDATPTLPDRRTGGFTFMELLAGLVLLALMASMAVPSMYASVDRIRTRSALDHLVADVSLAKVTAVQQGRRVGVTMSSGSTYTVDTISDGGSWGVLKTVDLDREFRGVSFVASGSLQFSSRGMLINQSSDGFIKIRKNTARDSVYVSPAGRLYRAY